VEFFNVTLIMSPGLATKVGPGNVPLYVSAHRLEPSNGNKAGFASRVTSSTPLELFILFGSINSVAATAFNFNNGLDINESAEPFNIFRLERLMF
jgi:hypothetical protein